MMNLDKFYKIQVGRFNAILNVTVTVQTDVVNQIHANDL